MLRTHNLFWIFLLILLSFPLFAIDEDELLPPEQAFKTEVAIDSDNKITIDIDIADGYYLYREKLKIVSEPEEVLLTELISPKGKIKDDEFFGRVETYRGNIKLETSVTDAAGLDQFIFKVTSQGCADLGICYPPMTLPFTLKPVINKPANTNPLASISQELSGSFGSDEEFLDPDVAFIPEVSQLNDGSMTVSWTIAEGYYLYKDKFEFDLTDSGGASIDGIALSEGEIKDDPFFGEMEVFHDTAEAKLTLSGTDSNQNGSLLLTYQGCAEAGICYPPIKKEVPVTWSFMSAANAAEIEPVNIAKDNSLSEQDQIAENLSTSGFWGIVASFFGLGLLLAFTPCVFPMIPILSSIIVGQGENITSRKAFTLSLIYVLAMAMTYTVAGVIVGLSGENVQAIFQNPWILSAFAALFVVLSLSMFGFYELQMPASIQSKLTALSNRQEGGTFAGVAIMGFLSALIVGPCVTAPLVGALIYIAQTGDAVIGGVALFALSMGMGVPLIIIGVSAGKYLPRAGAWMDATKAIFGVLLIALAIWMLERILPLYVTMFLASALLLVSGVYLGAFETIGDNKSGWKKLWKGFGIILVLYGTMLFVGAASGGTGFIKPLKGVFASTSSVSGTVASNDHLEFKQVKGLDGLQSELNNAQQNGQTVMLDFYADWCISCKEMEAYTFSEPEVQTALRHTLLLQSDVTKNDDLDKELLKHFGLFGPPAIIFYDEQGNEQRKSRVVGFMNAEDFTYQINRAFVN